MAARPAVRCDAARSAVWAALLLLLAAGAAAQAPGPAAAAPTRVSTAQELLAALSDPSVTSIAVWKPFTMPSSGLKPARVARTVLVTSPHRAMIDFCDAACKSGRGPHAPFVVLEQGAMVTFNRLFFRNFIPPSPAAAANPALDFANSPVPFIVSRGGQAVYNLVVLHWLRPMLWVLDRPANASFWAAAAAAGEIASPGRAPLQRRTPQLYSVKSFTTSGAAMVSDCYMPFDLDGCLPADEPFDTTLVYCPYTFKDSLRNPWVKHVRVFHGIGLDRLVNSYRNPVVLSRAVVYASCAGTRHTIDLDNITSSVLVGAGGALTLSGLVLQGSKSQNKTDWPSNVPLLLSAFKPVESGSITLRDSTVRVHNMTQVIRALNELPNGTSAVVEVPDLQPNYAGAPPALDDGGFVVQLWQLQQQRWMLSRNGGSTITDHMGTTANWQLFNVSVEGYEPRDCFASAVLQGGLLPGGYSTAADGEQLLDQLANGTARYIRITSDIRMPRNLGRGRVAVNRIVEVRACTADGQPFTIDWGGNHDAVLVSGNIIFEGNLIMKGIGWTPDSLAQIGGQIVDAVHPMTSGVIEYEDLALLAEVPRADWAADAGRARVAVLLGVPSLQGLPSNISVMAPLQLLLRSFYLNRTAESGGTDGLESFIDVTLSWSEAAPPAPGLSGGALLAAAIVPAVVGSLALGLVLAFFTCRAMHRRHAAAAASASQWDTSNKGSASPHASPRKVVPSVFGAGAFPHAGGSSHGPPSSGAIGVCSAVSAAAGGSGMLTRGDSDGRLASTTSAHSGSSRIRSGPSDDILQACRKLVLRRSAGEADELVLQTVIGEGSYGKVFKATWRGTTVAVKIMVLPSRMTGKEKREKMAVMETAISSSLSHPNVVQTFTYAVEPVRGNTKLLAAQTEGPGAHLSLHDSTNSCRPSSGKGSDDGGEAFTWEVRLVQEFCDLGSLRDALKANRFRDANGAVQLGAMLDTALDVARAVAHLHRNNILHSDLKARNVLLRSEPHDPRGFSAKVADFGLSLTIDPSATHISNAFQGTLTHMAPETILHGKVSRASDSYAFGVLLWELYTGEHAYRGVPRALLGHHISKQGLRPTFPPGTPFELQFLACRCWESDAAIRPNFEDIMQSLKLLKAKCCGADAASSTSCSPDHSALLPPGFGMPSAQLPSSLVPHAPANTPPGALALMRAASMQQQQQRLPSIGDSETLPSSVDRELWAQQREQTLQQQQLARQTSSGVLTTRTSSGAAAAAAAAAASAATATPERSAGSSRAAQSQQPGGGVAGGKALEQQEDDVILLLSTVDSTLDTFEPQDA